MQKTIDYEKLPPDDRWNAGDMGCGELILKLKVRMTKLAPGQILHLTAQDTGALEDIPAWCKMTGHALQQASHPNYWIQRRKD